MSTALPKEGPVKRVNSRRSLAGSKNWVRVGEAAAIILRDKNAVYHLAGNGHVRTHELPGLQTLFFVPDLRKLAPPAIESRGA